MWPTWCTRRPWLTSCCTSLYGSNRSQHVLSLNTLFVLFLGFLFFSRQGSKTKTLCVHWRSWRATRCVSGRTWSRSLSFPSRESRVWNFSWRSVSGFWKAFGFVLNFFVTEASLVFCHAERSEAERTGIWVGVQPGKSHPGHPWGYLTLFSSVCRPGSLTGSSCWPSLVPSLKRFLFFFVFFFAQIVTECNNGVRKMKRIEELVSLETLLDFDKVKVGLFFFFFFSFHFKHLQHCWRETLDFLPPCSPFLWLQAGVSWCIMVLWHRSL